jgi:hypothetical protein
VTAGTGEGKATARGLPPATPCAAVRMRTGKELSLRTQLPGNCRQVELETDRPAPFRPTTPHAAASLSGALARARARSRWSGSEAAASDPAGPGRSSGRPPSASGTGSRPRWASVRRTEGAWIRSRCRRTVPVDPGSRPLPPTRPPAPEPVRNVPLVVHDRHRHRVGAERVAKGSDALPGRLQAGSWAECRAVRRAEHWWDGSEDGREVRTPAEGRGRTVLTGCHRS